MPAAEVNALSDEQTRFIEALAVRPAVLTALKNEKKNDGNNQEGLIKWAQEMISRTMAAFPKGHQFRKQVEATYRTMAKQFLKLAEENLSSDVAELACGEASEIVGKANPYEGLFEGGHFADNCNKCAEMIAIDFNKAPFLIKQLIKSTTKEDNSNATTLLLSTFHAACPLPANSKQVTDAWIALTSYLGLESVALYENYLDRAVVTGLLKEKFLSGEKFDITPFVQIMHKINNSNDDYLHHHDEMYVTLMTCSSITDVKSPLTKQYLKSIESRLAKHYPAQILHEIHSALQPNTKPTITTPETHAYELTSILTQPAVWKQFENVPSSVYEIVETVLPTSAEDEEMVDFGENDSDEPAFFIDDAGIMPSLSSALTPVAELAEEDPVKRKLEGEEASAKKQHTEC